MNTEVNNRVYFIDLVLIGVFCIAFFGYRLGSFVPLSDHEGYVAVTAQEALQGNWIVPHFDGQIRLQKTPLMYWTVAGLATLYGGLDEFIVRLPSALAASGVAILLTIMVTKMFTRISGLICGLATASATGMLWQSHVGNADMIMTFFVVLCMLFFYLAFLQIEEGKTVFWKLMAGYVAFGLAMLAKGPVPIIAVLLPLFFYLLWSSLSLQWDRVDRSGAGAFATGSLGFLGLVGLWAYFKAFTKSVVRLGFAGLWAYFKKCRLLPGLVIFAVILGAWVVPVIFKIPNAVYRWKAEYLERYLGDFGVGGTERAWYYYFPMIFILTLPWSFFLPVGLCLPFRKALKEKRHELMFLFLWLVVGFVFFSISGGKRTHYILPILPPAIVLSALGMIYSLEHWFNRKVFTIAAIGGILLSAAGMLVGFFYIKSHFPEVTEYYRNLAAILLFAECLALVAYFRLNTLAAATVIALATGICFAIIWPLFPKVTDIERNPKEAAELIKQTVGPDAEIHFIGKAHGPLIFYYGRRMPQIPEDQEIVQIFKSANADLAIAKLQIAISERIIDMVRQPKCVYFVASDTRYTLARGYARHNNVKLYELLRIPGFFSIDKSLVLFSNCPKKQ
jgi:4-amino-4-deoxy-L-arabinose transferase-like glycosyltransferase